MTLATLGLAVDSSQVKSATAALGQLNAASASAAKGADRLAASGAKSETAMRAIEAAAKRSGISTAEMEKRFDAAAAARSKLDAASLKAANSNEKLGGAVRGLSADAKNLSFQIVDVTQGLVSGQPVFQIFAQQAGQIGQIIGTSPQGLGGLMRELGGAISRVVTPTRLVAAGFVAVGAAALAAASSWKTYALAIDDVRRISGLSSSAMSGLTSAAGFKGIGSSDFLEQFRDFAGTVAQARIGVGDLAVQFRAMGQPIGNSREAFERLADAIKNAANDQQRIQLLQAAGLPTTRQWIDFMSQGAAAIRDAVGQANAFGGAANDNMIRKAKEFEDSWNRGITNLRTGWNKLFLDVFGWFDQLSSKGTAALIKITSYLPQSLRPNIAQNLFRTSMQDNVGNRLTQSAADDFYGSVSSLFNGGAASGAGGRGKATPDPQAIMAANTRYIQMVGTLGNLASVEQQVQARSKELDNQYLQSGVSVGKYKDAILNLVRAQVEMNKVGQQAQIGVFNLDAANKAAQDTLQSWVAQKLLDPTNANQMAAAFTYLAKNTRDLADAASVAGSNLPSLQRALNDASDINKQLDQFATSSFNNITTGLADIFDGTKSASQGFADLGKTVLRSLEEMLVKMYIVLPIFNALKGVLGGGGLLGSLLPATVKASALGNVFPANDNGISRYSNQIVSHPTVFAFANGVGLMGEAGAEAIMPLQRGSDGKLGVRAGGGGAQVKNEINIVGGGINPNDVEVRQTEDGRGNVRTDIVLDQAVANALSRSGSQTRRAMGNNYGARPVGVRR